jgi:hypothetical protein
MTTQSFQDSTRYGGLRMNDRLYAKAYPGPLSHISEENSYWKVMQ